MNWINPFFAAGRKIKSCLKKVIPAKVRWPFRFVLEEVKDLLHPLLVVPRTAVRISMKKRVLGIFHYQEVGYGLGDMVNFLQTLNVLRHEHKLEKIDICYVDDPKRIFPAPKPALYTGLHIKRNMLSLHSVLPHVGSVFYFDSNAQFERFFRGNYHRYVAWPPYPRYYSWPGRVNMVNFKKINKYSPGKYSEVARFHRLHGHFPHLSCKREIIEWAMGFVREKASASGGGPCLPVVSQLRYIPSRPERNTDIDVSAEFFEHYSSNKRFKFIIIGTKEEVIPSFRRFPNVVFAKDFGTSLEQDFALIQTAHLGIFQDSGAVVFALFTGIPNIRHGILPYNPHMETYHCIKFYENYPWLNKYQKMFWGHRDAKFLIAEFDKLVEELDKDKWKNPVWEKPPDSDDSPVFGSFI